MKTVLAVQNVKIWYNLDFSAQLQCIFHASSLMTSAWPRLLYKNKINPSRVQIALISVPTEKYGQTLELWETTLANLGNANLTIKTLTVSRIPGSGGMCSIFLRENGNYNGSFCRD